MQTTTTTTTTPSSSTTTTTSSSTMNTISNHPPLLMLGNQRFYTFQATRTNSLSCSADDEDVAVADIKRIDKMDLGGWNSDFDSSLLHCWNDNTETNSQVSSTKKENDDDDDNDNDNVNDNVNGNCDQTEGTTCNSGATKSSCTTGIHSSRRDGTDDDDVTWSANLNARSLARLPSFNMYYETPSEQSLKEEDEGGEEALALPTATSTMNTSTCTLDRPAGNKTSGTERAGNDSFSNQRQLHGSSQESGIASLSRATAAPSPVPVSTAESETSTKDGASTAGSRSISSTSSSTRLPRQHDNSNSSSSARTPTLPTQGAADGSSITIPTARDVRGHDNTGTTTSNSSLDGPRLHPLAIPSSANCPRHGAAGIVQDFTSLPATVGGSSGLPYQPSTSVPGHGLFPFSLASGVALNAGTTASATAASFSDSLASMQRQFTQQIQTRHQQHQQSQSSLTHTNTTRPTTNTQAMPSAGTASATNPNPFSNLFHAPSAMTNSSNNSASAAASPHQQHHQQRHQHQHQQHLQGHSNKQTITSSNSTSNQALPASSTPVPQQQQQQQQPQQALDSQQQQQQKKHDSEKPPPFYLFDAPIELRANFMQSQRKLGIPVMNDCNSYHYGETVKGFHPQLISTTEGTNVGHTSHQHGQQQISSLSTSNAPVHLIDARHGGNRQVAGRIKNEREQKRAQKITELIEQLRVKMESGGWKVEMRSKYHTLSSCADYVKHLTKTLKDKEEIVNKLKSDLQVKQREIEEDKALQESRSDPESVISTLTSSTAESGRHRSLPGNGSRSSKATGNLSFSSNKDGNKRKRQYGKSNSDQSENPSKKNCSRSSGNTSSSASGESTGGDDCGRTGSEGARAFSGDKTVSSVSDITDSNRGSSTDSGQPSTLSSGDEEGHRQAQRGSDSISSDAAVASTKEVVFKGCEKSPSHRKRKRPPAEVTSIERSFELDYEEVFDNSNVPQLIASTSGKIVTWNDCFIKATGLKKSEVQRMTIFSLVKPDKLSNLFEIAAAALRTDTPIEAKTDTSLSADTSSKSASESESKLSSETEKSSEESNDESKDVSERLCDYAAMTLPCIDFPALKRRREAAEPPNHFDPLYVTVTLMADEDLSKRCFHCAFTDCPGTNGALGSITPELLSLLFTPPEPKSSQKSMGATRANNPNRKRARTPEQEDEVANKTIAKQSSELSSCSTNTEQQESSSTERS